MARDRKLERVIIQEQIDAGTVEQVVAGFRSLFTGADGTTDQGTLGALVGHLPLAAITCDADGTITSATGLALDRIGLGGDELVGTPVAAWGPAAQEYVDRVRDGVAHVFDAEGTADDATFRFRIFGVPDGAGGSMAIVIDLSDAFAAERAVDVNRSILEAAIDGSGVLMYVKDANDRVLSANPAARALLGLERGLEPASSALAHLDPVHEDGGPFERAELPGNAALRTGVPRRNVTVGLLIHGSRRWMSVSATPVTIEGQAAVVTTLADVTVRPASTDLLRDSDERFRLLAEEAPIGIFIVGVEGEMLYVNPATEQLAGRSLAEIRAIGWEACTHPDDLQALVEGTGIDELDQFTPVEYRILRPDGTVRWVRSSGALLHDGDGVPIGLVGTAADVTALREADHRLRKSEQRTRAILETAAEGIVSCDQSGTIIELNAAAERIFGVDSDDMIGVRQIFELFTDGDRDRVERAIHGSPGPDEPPLVGASPHELVGRRGDGTLVPVEVAVTEVAVDDDVLFTTLIRDLTEHKAFERELEHLATHDALTGLPNRALLSAQLEGALLRADRMRRSIAVLFVDIDRVKLVTEALGHRAGDELIVQAAERLRGATGDEVTLGRFSNDQFVLYLEDQADLGDAVDTAVAIIEAINEPFMVGADEAFVAASVGIAYAIEGIGDADTLISNADVAMGRAKVSSVNRYEVFDSEMRAWVEAQRKTEIALRHGIERNEFELYYQPVVALDTNETCGHEALVRWNHPNLGTLAPAAFMPLAEESGLIVPLGERILRDAIRQSAEWDRDGSERPANVAINLSARQLESPDLATVVRTALEEFDADPAKVAFEITETVLLDDVDTVVRTLDELKRLGVRLSLDDFGTGYSSLTYLCRLPIDVVKVDRSFVSQLGTGSRDASIVEMVVTMARTLQLDVVAEGVETEEQAEVLRGWGCPYAQGFLFARPKPVAELP